MPPGHDILYLPYAAKPICFYFVMNFCDHDHEAPWPVILLLYTLTFGIRKYWCPTIRQQDVPFLLCSERLSVRLFLP